MSERASDRGRIRMVRRHPGLLLCTASGYLDILVAGLLIHASEAEMEAHGALSHFVDWREVNGYASQVRQRLTAWVARQAAPVPRIVVLSNNRLVHMGVSAAAMALALSGRTLESYTVASRFEAALRDAEVMARLRRAG